jgi:nucleotide-binding universal stress UspA family protein
MAHGISKILVAVDQSENAERAFEYAMNLAKVLNLQVFVILVIDLPLVFGGHETITELHKLVHREAKLYLMTLSERAEKHNIKIETIVEEGYPPKLILDTSKSKGADLIVVGSRGRGAMKELFLGSVSHAVVNKSDIPVLVVK